MSYEEEFDKIVRQKAGEAEYPFDENNWLKTSRLLDAEREIAHKSSWKKVYLPAAVILGGGLILALFISPGNPASDQKMKPVTEKNSEPLPLNTQSQQKLTTEVIPAQQDDHKIPGSDSEIENISAQDAVATVPAGKSNGATVSPENKSGRENIPARETSSPADVAAPRHNIAAPVDHEPLAASVSSSDNKAEQGQHTAGPADKSGSNTSESDPKLAAGEKPLVTGEEKKQPEAPELNNAAAAVPAQEEIPAGTADVLIAEASEILTADWLQKIAPVSGLLADREITHFPFVPLKVYDDYFSKKGNTHYLNLEVGSAWLFGWNTAKGQDGKGLNWFAGINYGMYAAKKVSIALGFQLYNISNITQPFYKGQQKDYGFGYSSSFTAITTDNLYYAAVPLKINYHPNRSNTVGVGLNAGYVVQAHSRIDSYNVADGVQSQVVSQGNNIVYESIENLNLMGSIFYSTRITTRFAINAEFMYGFTDIFKNTEQITAVEKPVGVRLSVNYFLFKK